MKSAKQSPMIEIRYDELPLADIIDYFVAAYKTGSKITRHEWFIDPAKATAILKLYIERGHAP